MRQRTSLVLASITAVTIIGVFVPAVVSAVSQDANTIVNADIGSTISISTSGTVDLSIIPTSSGSASSASDTVTVSTNNSAGYKLQLADADANTALTHSSSSLAASTGTLAAPITLANNTWGFRVDGAGGFSAGTTTAQTNAAALNGDWAGVPASGSPVTLKSTSSTASADVTTVWYGAMADSTNPNGTYTDTVTYTATGN